MMDIGATEVIITGIGGLVSAVAVWHGRIMSASNKNQRDIHGASQTMLESVLGYLKEVKDDTKAHRLDAIPSPPNGGHAETRAMMREQSGHLIGIRGDIQELSNALLNKHKEED